MNQLNSLIIEGNVVRQPELEEPATGFKVCRFSVAVNRWYKGKNGNGEEEVSYFDVETYGKMAELCAKQLEKGRGVRVVGRLKQNRWEDENKKLKSKVFVIAEHVEFKPKFSSVVADTNKAEEKKDNITPAPTETSATKSEVNPGTDETSGTDGTSDNTVTVTAVESAKTEEKVAVPVGADGTTENATAGAVVF